jgi:hypothetical protein
MGMPVPSRPHAIVFGSHEDDILMTEGLVGLKEQLSVGFLELTEDFVQRLPNFLNTFDAVVVGECNFQFAKSLVEDILGLQVEAAVTKQAQQQQGKVGGRRGPLSIFERAGDMLGGGMDHIF